MSVSPASKSRTSNNNQENNQGSKKITVRVAYQSKDKDSSNNSDLEKRLDNHIQTEILRNDY